MTDTDLTLNPRLYKLLYASRRLFSLRYRLIVASILIVLAGALAGAVTAYALSFGRLGKEITMFDQYRSSEFITVYADDGTTEIGKFAPLRHKPLKFEQIPPLMRKAILAVEDPHFYSTGLNRVRTILTGVKSLAASAKDDTPGLARQLARKLSPRQGVEGRIQTWLLAVQMQRFYTKDQIIETYANHAWLGENIYGFEAGAAAYFNKPLVSLTPEEAALLAGVPKSPRQYSPVLNVEAARERRDQVLDLMARHGFLSQRETSGAKALPVQLAPTSAYLPHDWQFDYPLEEIRQYLESKYGALGGLKVYTTINVKAQTRAVEEVRAALRHDDRGRGVWRSDYINISKAPDILTQQQLDIYQHPHWYREDYQPGSHVTGLITRVDRDRNEAKVRFGTYTASVTAEDMGWSGRQPKDEFKVGDLAEFKITEKITASRQLEVELSQVPITQGALVTLNAKTGEIIAMVGGYDFNADTLNNATAAHQTGSAFKPFIYAAAVEWGMTPDTVISGEATRRRGSWQPRNYDGSPRHEKVPMREALSRNYNIAAVHTLDTIGIQMGAQMVHRFGVTTPMSPYLSSALGETDAPLGEMVSAYSAFANRGVRVDPHLIQRVLDHDGRTLEQWEQTSFKVLSDYVALTMSDVMRGPVEEGAAKDVTKEFGRPLAGAVGVTVDGADRWFIGYTPTYVTGVWVDNPVRGARPALLIFVSFMKYFLDGKPVEEFEKPPRMPEDIKELYLQRQREMREEMLAERASGIALDTRALPATSETMLETITLPPPPVGTETPTPSPTQPAPARRPREVPDTSGKKGKKGNDDN